MKCAYRIYPSWFGKGGIEKPMAEMAHGAAARMGRQVLAVDVTGSGEDHGGEFFNFTVTYSSTDVLKRTS